MRLFICIWNLPCPVAALGIGLVNDCCIMSVMTIANDLRIMSGKFVCKYASFRSFADDIQKVVGKECIFDAHGIVFKRVLAKIID